MVDRAIREARLIIFNQRDVVFPGNVLRGDDEVVPVDSRPEGYLLDFAARNAAAHGRAVQHVGKRNIVNVPCSSRDFVAPFLSRRGQADDVIVLHVKLGTNIWEELKFGPKEFSGSQYCERKPKRFVYLISANEGATADIRGRLDRLGMCRWQRRASLLDKSSSRRREAFRPCTRKSRAGNADVPA